MDNLVKLHNEFISQLAHLQELWGELREGYLNNRTAFDSCSPSVQQFFSVFGLSEFYTMMPRLMDFARGYGGFEQFLQPMDEEEEEE